MFSVVLRVLFWEIEQIPGFLKEGCTLSQWDALNCTLLLRRGTRGRAEYSDRGWPLRHPHEARYDDTASWYALAYDTDNGNGHKRTTASVTIPAVTLTVVLSDHHSENDVSLCLCAAFGYPGGL